jgi:hypothetical protein
MIYFMCKPPNTKVVVRVLSPEEAQTMTHIGERSLLGWTIGSDGRDLFWLLARLLE